ncbi:peptide deformylase [candidate division NPL-UPA2 bacterium]|nr:peptide deformylase [candidate division NPL-UPA2 bacterium]
MAVRKIRIYGDPILREKAHPVKEVNPQTKKLIKDMAETMYENKGLGLAANQIGIGEQVMTVDVGEGLLVLINARVMESRGEESVEEGCLSLPDIKVEVKRAKKIKVRGLDEEGRGIEIEAEGLLARAIQHEIDHLNGILIADRISFVRRQLISSQLKRLIKNIAIWPLTI